MGKNIYEMLNDVKINEDEYEKMELTEFDKAQKQKRILKKIKKNNKSGKNIRKSSSGSSRRMCCGNRGSGSSKSCNGEGFIQQHNRKTHRKPSGNKR